MWMSQQKPPENMLGVSWHDSQWIPILNPSNIMDYFSERSNPFYDRNCNNEMIKMQRLNPEQLVNMTGTEYVLLHVQEPILYVVRKQHRHQGGQTTPLADYYIIAGVVYQAPDLGSVINSRILSAVHHLQSAFTESQSYSRYNANKGYWWDFGDQEPADKKGVTNKTKDKVKEEVSSPFQRQRVDMLLGELAKKFPPKFPAQPAQQQQPQQNPQQPQTQPPPPPYPEPTEAKPPANNTAPEEATAVKQEVKQEPKTERPDGQTPNNQQPQQQPPVAQRGTKPPPEKRPRMAP